MLREMRPAGALPRAHLRHRRPHHPDAVAAPAAARIRSPRRCWWRSSATAPSTASDSSSPASGMQGIVHVIGPELGLTQPGMTIACGDSHTSTHGAFGAVAFGIGTSQVRDVLATQCLALRAAEAAPHRGDREARRRRLREGRDPRDHPAARRERRRRLRVRVRGPGDRGDDDRGAAHRLQHVDRGRRALRLRESRRDDVRLPARDGRSRRRARISSGPRRPGARSRATPMRRSPIASRSRGTPSRRPSPGASTRDRASASTRSCPSPPSTRAASAPRSKRPTLSWV